MKTRGIRIVIVVFWLVMMVWLIRFEAFPQWFHVPFGGYKSLFQDGPLILDSWMQITMKDTPVGYSHTWVDSHLDSRATTYSLRNQTVLNMTVLGQAQWVNVTADATLDEVYQLQEFSAGMQSTVYNTRIIGKRLTANKFSIRILTRNSTRELTMDIPNDVLMYSPMTDMLLKQLKPGQAMQLRVLDPMTLTVSEIGVKALRAETLRQGQKSIKTTALEMSFQGITMNAWIDENGRMVRQETPFGLTLNACAAADVYSTGKGSANATDLAFALAVPCSRDIESPRSCRELKIKMTGMKQGAAPIVNHRQSYTSVGTNAALVTLLAQPLPTRILPVNQLVTTNLALLTATPSLQSDHPDIRARAKDITQTCSNSWEAAVAISDWVYKNVEKKPTASLPSALDVLKQRVGDCNEHTYLCVALARAAGLPAQINVGIVYAALNNAPAAFYYHAWPSIYVGEWVEMDPTLGQLTVDATHITLVEGDLMDQLGLMGYIGQVRIELLEEK